MNKLITIFKIPELRQKILITLLFLAIYRIGYYVPLPIIDQEQMSKSARRQPAALGQVLGLVSMFSGGNLSQSLHLRPGHHALHLGVDHLPAPRQRLSAAGEAAEGRRERAARRSTNTPATPPCCICLIQACFWVQLHHRRRRPTAGMGLAMTGYDTFWYFWLTLDRHHDRRHHLPDVARRADRRVRHRQRHQPDHHGRHRRPHPGRHRAACSSSDGQLKASIFTLGGSGTGGDVSLEKLIVLILLFVAVVVGVIAITKGQRRIPTQSAKHVRGRRVYGGTRQFLPLRSTRPASCRSSSPAAC